MDANPATSAYSPAIIHAGAGADHIARAGANAIFDDLAVGHADHDLR